MNASLETARKKLTRQVMGRPGISGTAVTQRGGETCLVVYLADEGSAGDLPSSVDGFRVVVEKTGGFRPLGGSD